ncbi:flagellar basal body-associated FliL family protein [bacterium]|nr:flagellar basal body-associated FliL family protein [bacterium]
MPHRHQRRFSPLAAWILAAMFAMATAPGFGSAEKNSEKGESAGKSAETEATATPRPQYRLGQALKGRYDISVLLSNERVSPFQYEINDVRSGVGRATNWAVQLSIALEFGAGTGVAECENEEAKLRDTIRTVLMDQSGQQLLTTAGKIRFKHQLISMFNATFQTARVRQVYFTEIHLATIR